MKVLIITSDRLNPKDYFNSSFELALAESLRNQKVASCLLSVHIVPPIALAKAFLIKLFFSFKKNENTKRFSFRQLSLFFGGYFFSGRKQYMLEHEVFGLKTYEAVCIRKTTFSDHFAVGVQSGLAIFSLINKKEKLTVVHGHSRFFLGASLANAIFHQYGLPYIITEHSSYYLRGLVPESLLPEIKKIYDESAFATAVSNALRNKVVSITGTIAKIEIVGNPLPKIYTEEINFPSENHTDFIVISVARLDENKNHALLINGFSKASIPNSRLVIAGDGETKDELIKLVNSLGLQKKVHFLGELSQKSVRDSLLKSDVLVVSSKAETFCVALIEAQACGIPVISTPCGGPEELIESDNGILLKGFTESQMADAINQIYINKEKYKRGEIRNKALKKFGPEGVAAQFKTIYEKVQNGQSQYLN